MSSETVKLSVKVFKHLMTKLEVLSHSMRTLTNLFRDNVQPGMSQAQATDPIRKEIVEAIQNKRIRKWKLKSDTDFDLKFLIGIGRKLKIKKGVLYRRTS